jgi:hypothetical protein
VGGVAAIPTSCEARSLMLAFVNANNSYLDYSRS